MNNKQFIANDEILLRNLNCMRYQVIMNMNNEYPLRNVEKNVQEIWIATVNESRGIDSITKNKHISWISRWNVLQSSVEYESKIFPFRILPSNLSTFWMSMNETIYFNFSFLPKRPVKYQLICARSFQRRKSHQPIEIENWNKSRT